MAFASSAIWFPGYVKVLFCIFLILLQSLRICQLRHQKRPSHNHILQKNSFQISLIASLALLHGVSFVYLCISYIVSSSELLRISVGDFVIDWILLFLFWKWLCFFFFFNFLLQNEGLDSLFFSSLRIVLITFRIFYLF